MKSKLRCINFLKILFHFLSIFPLLNSFNGKRAVSFWKLFNQLFIKYSVNPYPGVWR